MVRIIGLGNPLMGDDGIGIHVIERLRRMQLPDNVELVDAGNCGLGLLGLLDGADRVIIVDALSGGNDKPGEILKLDPKSFKLREGNNNSSHYLSLSQALELAEILDYGCKLLIVGVTAHHFKFGVGLSPTLEAVVPKVIETVCKEL